MSRHPLTLIGMFLGLTLLAIKSSAQDTLTPTGGEIADANEDWSPKPIGKPFIIDLKGNKRMIPMHEGRSTRDTKDPARVVHYHELDLSLVPNEEPLPGYPTWVRRVFHRGNDTIFVVRFRLSSRSLRDSCVAKLFSDERPWFEREKERLGVPAIKLDVHPVPATDLVIAIQDNADQNPVTLAYDQEYVKEYLWGSFDFQFRFTPENLANFFIALQDETLQFKTFYKVRADKIIEARKRTDVDYELGLTVERELDSRQRTKLKSEDEYTVHPILQSHVNEIARKVLTDIRTDISASDPELLVFLQNDTLLVASCFDPAKTLTYSDFRSAFPSYTDQMLAEPLKPYGITKAKNKSGQWIHTDQEGKEIVKESGGGIGISVPIFDISIGLGGSKADAKRFLQTVFKATGVKLEEAEIENFYKPMEVEVHQLAEGYETKKLSQASSITLSKGPLNSYLEQAAFPPTYVEEVVDESVARTLGQHNHVARLLKKRAELQAARKLEYGKIDLARKEQKSHADTISARESEVHDAHTQVRGLQPTILRDKEVMRSIYNHVKAVWGWQPPGGVDHQINIHWESVIPEEGNRTRSSRVVEASQKAKSLDASIQSKRKEIASEIKGLTDQSTAIDKARKEIDRLNDEIAKVNKEILALLER